MADRTEEIRARVEKATPGPWTRTKPEKDADGWSQGVCIGATMGGKIYATPPGGNFPAADAEFIAHARSDIPYLLEENKRLREELKESERSLDVAIRRCKAAERAEWDARDKALTPSPAQEKK